MEVDNHRLDIFFFTFDTEWLIANFEMVPNVIYGMVLESLLTVNV